MNQSLCKAHEFKGSRVQTTVNLNQNTTDNTLPAFKIICTMAEAAVLMHEFRKAIVGRLHSVNHLIIHSFKIIK